MRRVFRRTRVRWKITDTGGSQGQNFGFRLPALDGEWIPNNLGIKLLFWGKYSEIVGGQMPNKKTGSTDYLTVSGSAGSETYQAPNTATYIAADWDFIWFQTDENRRTVSTTELVSYDFPRTAVKYLDDSPNSIEEIVILADGQTLSDEETRYLTDYMNLPILWTGYWVDEGHEKSNRSFNSQQLYTPETSSKPAPVSALIAQAAQTKAVITFDVDLDETSVPDTAAFAIAGKTITAVEVSGLTVTLTVSVTFEYADAITIDYTKPVSNPLVAAAGPTETDSFTGQAVTNNILYPAIIGDGNTTAFYEFDDLSTITKDAGTGVVSAWRDKLGNANATLGGSGTFTNPIWNATGGIIHDGLNQRLYKNFTLNQPTFIYAVLKQTTWNAGACIFDGYTANSSLLKQRNSTPQIQLQIVENSTVNANLVVNTWSILRVKCHAAASSIQVNETAATGGLVSYSTTSMGGICIGMPISGGIASVMASKAWVIRKTADDATTQGLIFRYLKNKYGVTY